MTNLLFGGDSFFLATLSSKGGSEKKNVLNYVGVRGLTVTYHGACYAVEPCDDHGLDLFQRTEMP